MFMRLGEFGESSVNCSSVAFSCLEAICPSMALVLPFVESFYGGFLLEVRVFKNMVIINRGLEILVL